MTSSGTTARSRGRVDPLRIPLRLAAVVLALEGRGFHLLPACAMRGEPLLRALRGLHGIGFCSDVRLLSRSSHAGSVDSVAPQRPFINLEII